MKKILSVVLLLTMTAALVFCLSACGEKDETGGSKTPDESTGSEQPTLVDTWEYETGGYTYIFKEDGTGTYLVGENTMEFTYTDENGTLKILYTGNTEPMELPYTIDGNTLTVKDSFGSDTVYKRK